MEITRIKIPAGKGGIAAVVNEPAVKTDRLAILCPGYLDSKDHAHLVALANDLCGLGYTVARFDPIGTWESEGDISLYLTSQYLEDIKSVLEYMLGQNKLTFVLLAGHSRGGQVSLMYAARDPRVSFVLAIEPSSNRTIQGKRYEDWKRSGFSTSIRDVPGTSETREFTVSYAHVEDRMLNDVFGEIKKVKVPILIVAGALDQITLPQDVRALYDAANEPKTFILIPNIGHDYRKNPSEIALVNSEIMKAINFSI